MQIEICPLLTGFKEQGKGKSSVSVSADGSWKGRNAGVRVREETVFQSSKIMYKGKARVQTPCIISYIPPFLSPVLTICNVTRYSY